MTGLNIVFQEIIYAECLYLIVTMLTFLLLRRLFNINLIQTTGTELSMTAGLAIVLFGIPYIMIQNPFITGMFIVAAIAFVLTGMMFLLSIEVFR